MKYYKHNNEIVAVTSYQGKTIRAVAKCNPDDEYSYDFGKDLATARANLKVATKRNKRACDKMNEAAAALRKAQDHYKDMCDYFDSSITEMEDAKLAISSLLEMINK